MIFPSNFLINIVDFIERGIFYTLKKVKLNERNKWKHLWYQKQFPNVISKSCFKNSLQWGQKNNTLVSRNAGDEKNLHPGGRKKKEIIKLNDFC